MALHDDLGDVGVADSAHLLDTEIGEVRLDRLVMRSPAIVVFEGRIVADARRVAVKCYTDPAHCESEERVLARLSGAPVPRLLGRARVGNREALLLEWIAGTPLSDWRTSGEREPDPDSLRTIVMSVADALGELHRKGVVHCDLKPAHVVVLPDRSVRLIDFSASILMDQTSEAAIHLTPETAAPEQRGGGQVGPWTDIHGFGVTLFWLLSGRLPRAEDATVVDKESDATAMALARRCLVRRPEDRPASVEDLRAALLDASFPSHLPAAEKAVPGTIQIRRRLPGSLPAAAAPESTGQRGRTGSRLARIALFLVIVAVLAVPAGWYGLIFYERHYKKDWVVDIAGKGDAATVAEVLERGGDDLTIRLADGRHLLPTITERHVSIGPSPDLESAPIIFADGGACTELEDATVRLTGLTFDATEVPENAVCIDISGGMATLSEIGIENAGGAGVRARRGARLEIDGLLLDGVEADGVTLTGGAEARIERMRITSVAGIGLRAAGGARVQAKEVSVSVTGGAGIAAGGGALVSVDGGLVEKTGGSAIDAMDGAVLTLADVHVQAAKGGGVAVYDGAHLSLSKSQITENALSGIFADGAASISLDDVGIARNGEHGAVLLSLREGVFRSVVIEDNKGAGVAIFPDVNLELLEMKVTGNGAGDVLDGRATDPEAPSDEEAGAGE